MGRGKAPFLESASKTSSPELPRHCCMPSIILSGHVIWLGIFLNSGRFEHMSPCRVLHPSFGRSESPGHLGRPHATEAPRGPPVRLASGAVHGRGAVDWTFKVPEIFALMPKHGHVGHVRPKQAYRCGSSLHFGSYLLVPIPGTACIRLRSEKAGDAYRSGAPGDSYVVPFWVVY